MILVVGSEVGGRLKRGLKERLTLFVVPASDTYTPLDNLQEKVRILSVPPAVGTRAGRQGQGPCLSHLGRKGHLPFNRHRDCNIPVSYISVKSINIL
jgi:hypothetical protein